MQFYHVMVDPTEVSHLFISVIFGTWLRFTSVGLTQATPIDVFHISKVQTTVGARLPRVPLYAYIYVCMHG